MLKWALIFFAIALVAGALHMGNLAGAASGIAVVLFWLFLAVTVVLFLVGLVSGRRSSI